MTTETFSFDIPTQINGLKDADLARTQAISLLNGAARSREQYLRFLSDWKYWLKTREAEIRIAKQASRRPSSTDAERAHATYQRSHLRQQVTQALLLRRALKAQRREATSIAA